MARSKDVEELTHSGPTTHPAPTKRRRWKRWVFGPLLLLLLGVLLLPSMLTYKPVLNGLVNRFAGIAPLSIEIDEATAGWMTPVSVKGVRVLDESQNVLVQVADLTTEKSVTSWATDTYNLGKITVRGIQANVVAADGTTNVEQALEPLIGNFTSTSDDETPQESTSDVSLSGSIQIADSAFQLQEKGRPEVWEVSVPNVFVTLPDASQVIGPIDANASIRESTGTLPNSSGQIAAQVKQANAAEGGSPSFELRAKMESLPLEFWHVLRARLPDIPVDELRGQVSGVVAGNIRDDSAWNVSLQELNVGNLLVHAPTLVGAEPATLQAIQGTANCSLQDSVLRVNNSQLVCDFASAAANAAIPWPIEIPTAQSPYLKGAEINARGQVDLPRLVAAAHSLIPIRQDTDLLAGSATFSVVQSKQNGSPFSNAKLELSGLKANAAGQVLTWDDPLSVELSAVGNEQALQLGGLVNADFAQIRGAGTIESGSLTGNVDLDTLRQRLAQWIELPVENLSGKANVQTQWKLLAQDVVSAEGKLTTTPVELTTPSGGRLIEPAWDGVFSAQVRLKDASPFSVESAHIDMTARDERIAFDLQEPLSLTQETPEAKPAAYSLDVHLDLANCNRRGAVWLTEPPEVNVSGGLKLVANGLLDMNHIEILNANWSGQTIEVSTSQLSFAEPTIVGKFKGRVDSNDITRTAIESLEMQSSSVSLVAQDEASNDGTGSRLGRARFLVDLGRLIQNANSGSSSLIAASSALEAQAPSTQYTATGRCEGEVAWQINSKAAGLNLLANTTNLVVQSTTPGQIGPSQLWNEPSLTTSLKGTWQAESSLVDISEIGLKTPWANYVGACSYTFSDEKQTATINGQAVYDAAQLANKLVPYTGGQINMAGQQTVPIQVNWVSDSTNQSSTLAGLNAATRLGWQQANVAGIPVGQADVPITVTNGILATAAEIPVSGGMLRWDINSDLTADQLVLNQKPMTLLENVQITEQLCKGWLKYVTPLMAETTSVDGRLSLKVDQAILTPATPQNQTVVGQLTIHQANVGPGPLSNSIIGIVKQFEAIRKKEFTQAVSSPQRVWMEMPQQTIDFRMVNGRVEHRNLNVEIGDAKIFTSGSVGVDGSMQMLASMPIPTDWTEKSPWLAGLRGQTLEFPMGGTVSNPQVDTRLLTQLGRQTIQNAASGLLQQGLNRGIDKLIGGQGGGNALGELLRGPGTAPAGTGQAAPPTGQNPVMGIGEQILRGQGIDLPGLFGGQQNSGGN